MDYAVELDALDENPLVGAKWTAMPKGKRKVDKRAVPNPIQARTLLGRWQTSSAVGRDWSHTSGTMHSAALRPEEAAALNKRNLARPEPVWDEEKRDYEYGWGELHLGQATPHVGAR
ncbi:hypothetical protein SAMN05421810_101462 [Amycolatopsis arida]|uniref:Uncharacterized protein n=1 Tax=Amycolatopsis arida TaxID=587909 RepID=A0A1I5L9A5_9PSEU|nr:hypothetical protein [Amycolatopsis arida]TDX93639.1 hypothetical protein CLV69_10495 [Amycolatopsis arida]SFO93954.1 hypothetical protein SAMN05421810_101462 [Amycolatopsis arida]